jgi:hypothetical protein
MPYFWYGPSLQASTGEVVFPPKQHAPLVPRPRMWLSTRSGLTLALQLRVIAQPAGDWGRIAAFWAQDVTSATWDKSRLGVYWYKPESRLVLLWSDAVGTVQLQLASTTVDMSKASVVVFRLKIEDGVANARVTLNDTDVTLQSKTWVRLSLHENDLQSRCRVHMRVGATGLRRVHGSRCTACSVCAGRPCMRDHIAKKMYASACMPLPRRAAPHPGTSSSMQHLAAGQARLPLHPQHQV